MSLVLLCRSPKVAEAVDGVVDIAHPMREGRNQGGRVGRWAARREKGRARGEGLASG